MSDATTPHKISSHHRAREACLYVRQSSQHQVINHTESTRRQYGLQMQVMALGWPADRIRIIDDDQGLSGEFSGVESLKKDFLSVLSTVMTGCGAQFPPRARAEIERIHARMKLVCAQIAEVETLRDALVQSGQGAEAGCVEAKAATLTRLHGIGNNDATLLSTEVFSRDFRNRRQLGSWAGLTSAPWSSAVLLIMTRGLPSPALPGSRRWLLPGCPVGHNARRKRKPLRMVSRSTVLKR